MVDELTFPEYSKQAETDNSEDKEMSLKYSIDMLLDEASTIYRYYTTSRILGDQGDRYLREMVPNKAGDILWYINNICSILDMPLETVAKENLNKINSRWGQNDENKWRNFDEGFGPNESFPRQMTFYLKGVYDDEENKSWPSMVELSVQKGNRIKAIGDDVDDNAIEEDYYRYHDIFHISYLAHLGWSPVIRRMMDRKRRSDYKVARSEDGRRAADIEEGLTSYVYMHSKKFILEDHEPVKPEVVDFRTHRTIDRLISGLEVRSRPREMWLEEIYKAIMASRFAIQNKGCSISIDLDKRSFEYSALPNEI